jgi:type II secretory pathway pseudopilin PulG
MKKLQCCADNLIDIKKNYKKNGVTLPEALVAILTFGLLTSLLIASMSLTIRWLGKADAEIVAHQTCSNALEIIVSEMRQAVPNPDPETGPLGTGYLSIDPTTAKPKRTAVLMPNYLPGNKESNYILFTSPNFENFDPAEETFDIEDPSCYKHVRFYVTGDGKKLIREVKLIDQMRNFYDRQEDVIGETVDGRIELTARHEDEKLFAIELSVTEASGKSSQRTYTGKTLVYILIN